MQKPLDYTAYMLPGLGNKVKASVVPDAKGEAITVNITDNDA
jgi:hypothetical protein